MPVSVSQCGGRCAPLGRVAAAIVFILISALLALAGPCLYGQDIHVRVLNGRNGKPIQDECLNVSLGPWHGADLIAPTNEQGIVALHLRENQVTAEAVPHPACSRTVFVGPKSISKEADTIVVSADLYVNCEEYAKIAPGERVTPDLYRRMIPSYPIKKILESGVTAGNKCGKFRAEAKPGELIFFVRPRTFLERMRE